MTTLALTLAPSKERVGARIAYQVAMVFCGALLMSGLAQVSIKLPFTPVPITGQTLGVLLVGASLGPSLGAASMLLYLAWGVVGLPVFAPQADGSHVTGWEALSFAQASAGYLIGFAFAAAAVGALARAGWDRTVRSSIGAMLIGEIVIYLFGIPWLMKALAGPIAAESAATGSSQLEVALQWGLYPFVIGDTLKLFAAAGLLPLAWKLTRRNRDD